MDDLTRLADLIREKNVVDNKIADIIGRPAQVGHASEYIAARIFGVTLHHSASYKSSDGYFINEPLAGRSVDIKWYLKHENILDLNPENSPDYYLVLTGPRSLSLSSRSGIRPWSIESVFLFESHRLIDALRLRGIKLGIATSVIKELWDRAEIYPVQRNNMLTLNDEQRKQLALFR